MSIKDDIKNMKDKLLLTGILTAVSLSGNAQTSFQRYQSQKQKESTEYNAQKAQQMQDYKDAKTAQFNAYANGSRTSGEEMVPMVDQPVETGVSKAWVSCYPVAEILKINIKVAEESPDGSMYYYSGDNGVALKATDGKYYGAVLEDDGIHYYETSMNETDTKTEINNQGIQNALAKVNERYGDAGSAFSQALQQVQTQARTQQTTINASQDNTQWQTIQNEHGQIQYAFTEAGIKLSGNIHIDVSELMPTKTFYNKKTKIYTVGTSQSHFQTQARNNEEQKIRTLVVHNDIYKDLQQQQKAGKILNTQESRFMQQHIKDLAKEGISMNAQGKLIQTNNYAANTQINGGMTR
ncbi:MAG: hypothetical protein IJ770_04845 [Alphaproteobacteria bacterium]|nr:hypothetical protein [Alphaproteobacteria bacterium]